MPTPDAPAVPPPPPDASSEPRARRRPIRRRRWYLVLLVLFWLLALPLLVLFYAILVENAMSTARGRAVILTMLLLIPLFLLHESWRWWAGRLQERRDDWRDRAQSRRQDDQPSGPAGRYG
jgi:membrane protein YdbS with pleckstrin-like domain